VTRSPDIYHASLALAHWTSHPELAGVRAYRYCEIAWLGVLCSAVVSDPFAVQLRARVAHSRIALALPRLDARRSRACAAWWRELGALRVHGSDARGTDYELVRPPIDELSQTMRDAIEYARARDYLAEPADLVSALTVASTRAPKESHRDAEKRRDRYLSSLDDARATRKGFAATLEQTVGLAAGSLRYKTHNRNLAREVEAMIDYCESRGLSLRRVGELCGTIHRDVSDDRPSGNEARWLFAARHHGYVDRMLRGEVQG
jgi:hypothetical protein